MNIRSLSKLKRSILPCAIAALTLITSLGCTGQTVMAAESYNSYNYNFWGEAIAQPQTFLYEKSFFTEGSDCTLSFPKDMFLKNDTLYIADTGNSRILVMDSDGNILSECSNIRKVINNTTTPVSFYQEYKKRIDTESLIS